MHSTFVRSLAAAAASLALAAIPVPAAAWCEAMGGYPSFEAQARAQAEQRRAEQQRVRSTQQSLIVLGYDPGPADGQAGPRTTAAVRQFLVTNNLPAADSLSAAGDQVLERCVESVKARRAAASSPQDIPAGCCARGARSCGASATRK